MSKKWYAIQAWHAPFTGQKNIWKSHQELIFTYKKKLLQITANINTAQKCATFLIEIISQTCTILFDTITVKPDLRNLKTRKI